MMPTKIDGDDTFADKTSKARSNPTQATSTRKSTIAELAKYKPVTHLNNIDHCSSSKRNGDKQNTAVGLRYFSI